MSRATVELDFFGMEKENAAAAASKSQFQKFLDRRRSFRGMQSAISKINPDLLKSVISSGSGAYPSSENGGLMTPSMKSVSVPSTPNHRPASESGYGTAPLTIFYNGTVAVFDVPWDKAESILKLAVQGSSKAVESGETRVAVASSDEQQLLDNGDLPIARRKSLQRFLEKRKERITSVSPYICPN